MNQRDIFCTHDLELDHLSFLFLVTTKLKMLAPFDWYLFLVLADGTFHAQDYLLSSLSFLPQNRLCLTTIAWLACK